MATAARLAVDYNFAAICTDFTAKTQFECDVRRNLICHGTFHVPWDAFDSPSAVKAPATQQKHRRKLPKRGKKWSETFFNGTNVFHLINRLFSPGFAVQWVTIHKRLANPKLPICQSWACRHWLPEGHRHAETRHFAHKEGWYISFAWLWTMDALQIDRAPQIHQFDAHVPLKVLQWVYHDERSHSQWTLQKYPVVRELTSIQDQV